MQVPIEKRIRIALVAHPVMCLALQQLLKTSVAIDVVSIKDGLAATHATTLASEEVDVIVLDYDGSLASPELLGFLEQSKARVVVIADADDPIALDSAVACGLHGTVKRSAHPGALLEAIEKVSQGELWIDRSAANRPVTQGARESSLEQTDAERERIALLTHRERGIIAALTCDTSVPARVIATRLCITENTLRNHLTNIYEKLHVRNRLELFAYANRHQLTRIRRSR